MTPLALGFIFVFGTVVGSFLNAVIWRLRTKEGFLFGRSYCPNCRHTLHPWDLVPIFSYIGLGGKCRYCKQGISIQYVLVELFVGLCFSLAAVQIWGDIGPVIGGTSLAILLRNWYFIAMLTVVFVFDLRYMLILRKVTLPATVLAFAANIALGYGLLSLLIGMGVGWGFFWLQYRISKGTWVGGGDMQLGLLMGAMLGVKGVLVALLLAYIGGAAFGLVLIATKRATRKTRIPFGTFLSLSTIVVLLYGSRLLDWYFSLAI